MNAVHFQNQGSYQCKQFSASLTDFNFFFQVFRFLVLSLERISVQLKIEKFHWTFKDCVPT